LWLLVLAAGATLSSCVGNRIAARGDGAALMGNTLALAGHLISTALFLAIAFLALPTPSSHASVASLFAVFFYVGLHGIVGMVFATHALWRGLGGHNFAVRALDLRIGRLWHDYTAAAGITAVAFCLLLGSLVDGGGI
jgi:cytochrome c oxidase subunit I+III